MADPTRNPGSGSSRYLPRWMNASTDTDSLLGSLLQGIDSQSDTYTLELQRAAFYRSVELLPIGEPYRVWQVETPASPRKDLMLVVTTSSGSGMIRRSISEHDFTLATDPVWELDESTHTLLLRNLAHKEVSLYSTSGVYTISGEVSGFVPDEDLHYRYDSQSRWYRYRCEQLTFSGNVVTLPVTGNVTIRYASQAKLSELASGLVTVTQVGVSTPALTLQAGTTPTHLDGYGKLVGLARLTDENSRAYRQRLLTYLKCPRDTSVTGVMRSLSAVIGTLYSTDWDGVSSKTLDDGSLQLQSVMLVDVPRLRVYREELLPHTDQLRFYAETGGWRQGAVVWVDDLPREDYTLTSNILTFPSVVSGKVTAEYSVERYTHTVNSSGHILTVEPGSGLTSGSYTLIYSGKVAAFGIDLPDVQQDKLLTSQGLPNRLFLDLAHILLHDNPTLFSHARWGSAVWFPRNSEQPKISRLALPFDEP